MSLIRLGALIQVSRLSPHKTKGRFEIPYYLKKRLGLILVIILVIVISIPIMDRPQEVLECPFSHVPALPPRSRVRGAEVDAFVDAHIDHIPDHIREAVIRARLLDGQRVGGRQ